MPWTVDPRSSLGSRLLPGISGSRDSGVCSLSVIFRSGSVFPYTLVSRFNTEDGTTFKTTKTFKFCLKSTGMMWSQVLYTNLTDTPPAVQGGVASGVTDQGTWIFILTPVTGTGGRFATGLPVQEVSRESPCEWSLWTRGLLLIRP